MSVIVIFLVSVVLFLLAFVTKRHYGILGLGLTAGMVLSEQIATETAALLRYLDFPTDPLSPLNAARVFLILAPSLLLMLAGPKYTDKKHVIIGSVLYALFGTFLLLAPLVASFPATDTSTQQYLAQIAYNSSLITALAVAVAVFDLMKLHRKKPVDKKAKH